MSYILDALKKAEAERHQGAIPSLHAQPAAALPADIDATGRKRLLVFAAGILLSALCILAWLRPWEAAPAGVTVTSQSPSPASSAPAVQPAAAPAIVVIAPEPAPAIPPAPAKAKPKPVVTSVETAARTSEPKPARTAVSHPPPMAQPTPAAALPTAAPSDLPSISLGGYIYSDTPSERQLLVNKRLMHEGEEVMPGLVLEKMLPKAAVFNYRGYRYQIAY